jgi:hypothetical protein
VYLNRLSRICGERAAAYRGWVARGVDFERLIRRIGDPPLA